jgi:undecaprenyl-phosphate 4-deoxy-4-formamido-L-arabinose transferase
MFISGIVLFGIGLLGEYVGRIYQEVLRRPRFRISGVLEQLEPEDARAGAPHAATAHAEPLARVK